MNISNEGFPRTRFLVRAILILGAMWPAIAAPAPPPITSEGSLAASGSGELPRDGTFIIHQISAERSMGMRIGRMLRAEVEQQGYRHETTAPDLVVSFGFDVARPDIDPHSGVVALFENTPRPEFAFDAANPHKSPPADHVFYPDSRRLNTHTMVVRFSRAATGDTLWQGVVTESAWCNAPPRMAPRMLTLMFDGFPATKSASRKMQDNGEKELALINIFPDGGKWDCLTIWHGRLPPR
jgi:hypothetical protein